MFHFSSKNLQPSLKIPEKLYISRVIGEEWGFFVALLFRIRRDREAGSASSFHFVLLLSRLLVVLHLVVFPSLGGSTQNDTKSMQLIEGAEVLYLDRFLRAIHETPDFNVLALMLS
jgi:hypothetical protein